MSAALRIATVGGDTAVAAFDALGGAPGELPDDVVRLLAWREAEPRARLTLWPRRELHGAAGPVGLIGHYEALDAEAGAALLRAAAQRLAAAGARQVLGPMNGSTWYRYRLALPVAGVEEPAFLGEPQNPPHYPAHFAAADFVPAAWYASYIAREPGRRHPRRAQLEQAVAGAGVTWAPLQATAFETLLPELFEMSLRAFAGNLYYAPIDWEAFAGLYGPARPLLVADLVQVARDAAGALVGYAFAYPDSLLRQSGRPTRVVLKTLAVAPEARGTGLGTLLTDEISRMAHRLGFGAVIHALMHEDNQSRRISSHSAQAFRRYALYRWTP